MGPRALHALRKALERQLGDQGSALLQEAGYAEGDEFHELLEKWLSEHSGISDPGSLDSNMLGEVLTGFFKTLGWGEVVINRIGTAALAVDSPNWSEAEPGAADIPSCNFTVGLLAALLGNLAGRQVAVMEVECRTQGDDRCRFLAGSPQTLQAVYEGLLRGRTYQAVLGV